ncbi:hypothetical protein CDIK_0234 [Cucumispora dikerogammari]|nr:hypothetical protein CDIK_0234 [Cucumispora dikerogammari]
MLLSKILFELDESFSQSSNQLTIIRPPTLMSGAVDKLKFTDRNNIISQDRTFIKTTVGSRILWMKFVVGRELKSIFEFVDVDLVKIGSKNETEMEKLEYNKIRKRTRKNMNICFQKIISLENKWVISLSIRPKDESKETMFSFLAGQTNRAFRLRFFLPVEHIDEGIETKVQNWIEEIEKMFLPFEKLLQYETQIISNGLSWLSKPNIQETVTHQYQNYGIGNGLIEKSPEGSDTVIGEIIGSKHFTAKDKISLADALLTILKSISFGQPAANKLSNESIIISKTMLLSIKQIIKQLIWKKISNLELPVLYKNEIIRRLKKGIDASESFSYFYLSELFKTLKEKLKGISKFVISETQLYKLNERQDSLEEVIDEENESEEPMDECTSSNQPSPRTQDLNG